MRHVGFVALASLLPGSFPISTDLAQFAVDRRVTAPPVLTAAGTNPCVVPGREMTIRGAVIDGSTTRGVARATVRVSVAAAQFVTTATTDDQGRFQLRMSRYDDSVWVALAVNAPGYTSSSPTVVVSPTGPDSMSVEVRVAPVPVLRNTPVNDATLGAAVGAMGGRAGGGGGGGGGGRGRGGGAAPPAAVMQTQMQANRAVSPDPKSQLNTEEYNRIEENAFVSVKESPLSTFAVDVDRASYSNVRRFVCGGTMPTKDAVRIEEMVNYFSYGYARPTGRAPVAITADAAQAPWNANHRIVRVALQTTPIATADLPPSNLVFLIDVSGSMNTANKLPLVKQAFQLLVDQLRPIDRVAMVVYAGSAGLVLPSTEASNKTAILQALERLEAGGSTAGGAGIQLAYETAKQNFAPRGNNRVILATDGDFNVGISSTSELIDMVEARRTDGIFLTVLGFGMGNIKDGRLEQLADKGNGNYGYIDDIAEARKMFVGEMGATLVTVAKDVKVQVEFNPRAVQAYRLIGYENRLLAARDFTNDAKDAGEMGAGHSVTALYEVILADAKLDVELGNVPPLRYQTPPASSATTSTSANGEMLTVSVRYKLPTADESQLLQRNVTTAIAEPDADFRFAMAVAGYGMLLRNSPHKGTASYERMRVLANGARGDDAEGYRGDFVRLVERTQRIIARER